MSNALLLTHLLEEFLVEIQLRIYSIRTLESVKDNNGLFLRYIESEFGITTLEKLLYVQTKTLNHNDWGDICVKVWINHLNNDAI